jgi:hypothetical protein
MLVSNDGEENRGRVVFPNLSKAYIAKSQVCKREAESYLAKSLSQQAFLIS